MSTVTISPDFHIELPLDVRQRMNLHPGQELAIFSFKERIELAPVRPIEEMRDFLKVMDSKITREEEERA